MNVFLKVHPNNIGQLGIILFVFVMDQVFGIFQFFEFQQRPIIRGQQSHFFFFGQRFFSDEEPIDQSAYNNQCQQDDQGGYPHISCTSFNLYQRFDVVHFLFGGIHGNIGHFYSEGIGKDLAFVYGDNLWRNGIGTAIKLGERIDSLKGNPILVSYSIANDGIHGFQWRKSLSFGKIHHCSGIRIHSDGVMDLFPNLDGKGVHLGFNFGVGLRNSRKRHQ